MASFSENSHIHITRRRREKKRKREREKEKEKRKQCESVSHKLPKDCKENEMVEEGKKKQKKSYVGSLLSHTA